MKKPTAQGTALPENLNSTLYPAETADKTCEAAALPGVFKLGNYVFRQEIYWALN